MSSRKTLKKLVAGLLCFSLILSVVSNWGGIDAVKAAETKTYTELTFLDWGIADGTYTSGKAGAMTKVTSIVGAAFNGIVHFTSTSEMIRFGGVSSEWFGMDITYVENTNYNGIRIRLLNDSGAPLDGGTVITESELGLPVKNQDVKLRLTFDLDGTSVLVGVYMNNRYFRTCTFANASACLGNKFVLNGSTDGFTVKSVIDYTEVTFSDLGIQEKTYQSASVEGELPTGISSLDGVAFRGNVTFPSDTQNSYIQFGYSTMAKLESEGIRVFRDDATGRIWFWDKTGGNAHHFFTPEQGDTFAATPVELYLAFRSAGDDIYVEASVTTTKKTYSTSWIMAGWKNTMGTGIFLNSHPVSDKPITVSSAKRKAKNTSFSDYQLDGEQLKASEIYKIYEGTKDDLEGYCFEDFITFSGNTGAAYVYFCASKAWEGIRLEQTSDRIKVIGVQNSEVTNLFSVSNSSVQAEYGKQLKATLEVQMIRGMDAYIRVYVNDRFVGSSVLCGYAAGLKNGLYAYAATNAMLTLGTKKEYERLTPLEFGLEDVTVTKGVQKEGNKYTGSLNRTYLDAEVCFAEGNIRGDSVRFASYDGWNGIQFGMCDVDGSTVLSLGHTSNPTAYQYSASELGVKYGTPFSVKFYFDIVEIDDVNQKENVQVKPVINGQELAAVVITDVPFDSSRQPNRLSVYAQSGTVSIATPYESVMFADMGIADKRYIAESVSGSLEVESMDGVALEGKIAFAEGSQAKNNHLKIGNRFLLGYDYNEGNSSVLMLDLNSVTNNHGVFRVGDKVPTDIAGKSIIMRLTFDYLNQDQDIQVGLFVDGICCGYNTFTDATETFATEIQLISNDKPILIGNAYTEWTLWDWNVEDGSISTATENKECQNTMLSTFEKSIFSAKMKFADDDSGNNSLRIGGWEDAKWNGLHIFFANGTLFSQDLFDTAGAPLHAITSSNLAGKSITLSLQFDCSGTDVKVSYYVDGVYCTTVDYVGAASKMGNYLILQTADGKELDYASVGERKVVEKMAVTYDLSDGNYLITGNAVSVNDIARQAGEELSAPGDYVIKRLVEGVVYKQTVSLYKVGDVNCDGIVGGQADLTTLRQLLATKNGQKVERAAEYAADLDNDGYLDLQDQTLMSNVVDQKITVDEVLRKYHVAAQTFDLLGGKSVMPIAGYRGPYQRGDVNTITDEMFAALKDSGLNMFNFAHNSWGEASVYTSEALSKAEKYGIGYFVDDFAFRYASTPSGVTTVDATDQTAIAKELSQYDYFESFLGTHLCDEPEKSELADYKQITKSLNSFTNTVGFVNLNPSDHTRLLLDYSATSIKGRFEQYCDDFFSANPRILSVDDYPFNDSDKEGTGNASGYFTSLAITRQKALQYNVPFWWYVQSGGCHKTGRNDKLVATYEERFWNVNTGLAFGAKGIEWFTAIAVDENAKDDNGDSLSGIVDLDGTTTGNTKGVKDANAQIKAVDEVLMKSTSKAIIASGEAKAQINKGVSGTAVDAYGKVTGVESTSKQGALVGYFDYRNTQSLYVVNYDVTANASATITLTMDGNYSYKAVDRDGNRTGKTEEDQIILTIRSGEAVLIVLDDVNATGTASEVANLIRYKRVEKGLAEFDVWYDGDANGDYVFDKNDVLAYRERLVLGYYK